MRAWLCGASAAAAAALPIYGIVKPTLVPVCMPTAAATIPGAAGKAVLPQYEALLLFVIPVFKSGIHPRLY